jgi:hypothetical protein
MTASPHRRRPTRRQLEVLGAYIPAGSIAAAAYQLGIEETTALVGAVPEGRIPEHGPVRLLARSRGISLGVGYSRPSALRTTDPMSALSRACALE